MIYAEADAAITSANTAASTSTSAYITTLLTIYDIESTLGISGNAAYLGSDTLERAYYDANKAYEDAKAANNAAKSELTKAEKALEEAEALFESAKDEGFTIFNKEWWDAKAEIKAAKKVVEEKTEKVEGTKKTDGTADILDEATKALNKAKTALVDSFITTDTAKTFVEAGKDLDSKKSTYNSKITASSTNDSLDKKTSTYNTAKDTYDAAKKAVEDAGDAVTAEQTKALEDATTALKEAEKALKECLDAAKAYNLSALTYYAESKVVEKAAKPDYDEAVAALKDTTDADGNVTKEGLETKIAKAEEYEKGEALTNVEVYGHLDAYLEHVLGYNWESVIREQAVEAVNEQIKFYAVAKALTYWEDENGNVYEVVANGYDKNDIKVSGYKAAIEAIEAEDNRITKLLEHSIKHNDEDIKDKKLQKETKKAYEELLEATDNVFVDNKVFKEYKKELGRSNYTYAKDQYGENNLRMYLQIENLLTYLLYTDIQENEYAMHDGEYTVRENAETGKLAYLFISYDFKAEDAE